MTRQLSRRDTLRLAGAGLGVGVAGCSADALQDEESSELMIKIWNNDTTASHEVYLELVRSEAIEVEAGRQLEERFTLTQAGDTGSDEGAEDTSSREFRVESQPYRVRVRVGAPSARDAEYSHYHFRPCVADTPNVLERIHVSLVKENEDAGPEIRWDQPC